jgi:hypothetical protein
MAVGARYKLTVVIPALVAGIHPTTSSGVYG